MNIVLLDFISPFVIPCDLIDITLHDSAKDAITLVCQLILNYFRDICITYGTAIILSYDIKQLVVHFVCLNNSLIQRRQNGVIFEEGGISRDLKCLSLKSFIIFPFTAWSFFWYYHLKDSFCSFSVII